MIVGTFGGFLKVSRPRERLKIRTLPRLKQPGNYADGAGLYLQVSGTGARSWILRYMLNGHAREMGLGSEHVFSLVEARGRAAQARKQLADGVDPIQARDAERARQALEAAKNKTFADCAHEYITKKRHGWRNAKHAEQWENTLEAYAKPIMALPVQAIDVGHVLGILEAIWNTKRETAVRLRGRIEKILDYAKARAYRSSDNPARWRGNLGEMLPEDKRRQRIKHHAALPYGQAAAFTKDLRAQEGTAARALEHTILNLSRTGETIAAEWTELDLDAAIWTIPAARMKGHREHRVPLSRAAVELLRALPRLGEYVFPGRGGKKPLSNMAMLQLLERMGRGNLTTHGFRSTFRDWAAERTNFPNHVLEMALAHAISDDTEAAYRRGDLFEKRRRLMDVWANYLNSAEAGKVTPIRKAAA